MKKLLTASAIKKIIVYSALCSAGTLFPNRFLISFKQIVLFTTLGYLILFIINSIRYHQLREKMDLYLMITWLLLGIVMVGYYLF